MWEIPNKRWNKRLQTQKNNFLAMYYFLITSDATFDHFLKMLCNYVIFSSPGWRTIVGPVCFKEEIKMKSQKYMNEILKFSSPEQLA